MKKASLSTETKNINMVIDVPFGVDIDFFLNSIRDFVSQYCANYFYIFHDKDKKNGEFKTPHVHLLFNSIDNKKHELKYYCNRLANDFFNTKKIDFITIDKWNNYEGAIQYLIHKNDSDKYQYDIEKIHCCDNEELERVMSYQITQTLTIDRIVNVCAYSDSLVEVYLKLGLGASQMYNQLIYNIWRDKDYLRKYRENNELPF